MPKLTVEETAFRQGVGLALAEVNRMFDQPTIVRSVMDGMGLSLGQLRTAGVDDYDLRELRKAFR
jgi:hypothetical protein